ncbi:MAG TPA: TlpA disulfide reductase family protein [Bryobacteraceae bacterium]|nr:TlpA disulfide reductase family protein [Bryobacteraceae bacterium]
MFSETRRAIALAVCMLAVAMSDALPAPAHNQAAEFSLRSIDGEAVTSNSLRGEVVVLAFGASWLPLTRNQMEAVKKLADQYAGRGVAVYWVSTESDSPKSKNYAADETLRDLSRKYKVTALRDPDGVVSKKLGVDQLPSVVIIDKQGNVAATVGGMDPLADLAKQLADRLNKIL